MKPAIRFDRVSKKFILHQERARSFQEALMNLLHLRENGRHEEFWALRDVSFEVAPGETVGIVGPNGAGKSTMLKLISRIVEPTGGQIEVNGRVGALLELGAGFHPDLTGRENVYLNGSILGLSRAEIDRKLDEIIAFAELERFVDVPVKHYSSGMHVRLGFSVAVHTEPEILLVDEVLAVGDQNFQVKCNQKITDLRREGMTISFVSHNLGAVRRMCDRAVWLDKGQVRSIGPPDDIIADYMDQVWHIREAQTQKAEEDQAEQRKTSAERRWGSGEAVIEQVVFIGADQNEQRVFRTGDRFVARIHYQAFEQVEQPTFGVAIYRDDGVHVNGPNSFIDGCVLDSIHGTGYMDYIIEALPLTPGRYEFTAAIYDHTSTHPYDHRHRAFTFEVQAGAMGSREGVVHIPSQWEHHA